MTETANMERLMQGVIPYLPVHDAKAAIAFYKRAFGAVQHGETVTGQDGRVMNAGLEINGGMLMLMDHFPEAQTEDVKGVTMQLVTRDGDLWWNRAVEAGCEVTHPFRQEFWGDRYGRLRDPFGIDWAIDEPGPGK